MPTYEYACTACGHRFDAVQRFTDEALTECPECSGDLRKVYGAVGIVLKGSGFYKTDSRAAAGTNGSKNGKGSARSEPAGDSPGGSGSDSGSGSDASSSSGSGSSGASEKSGTSEKKDSKSTASAASSAG